MLKWKQPHMDGNIFPNYFETNLIEVYVHSLQLSLLGSLTVLHLYVGFSSPILIVFVVVLYLVLFLSSYFKCLRV